MNVKHFNNKKILITGADGFIGSHLVESLVKKGFNVKAFVFYNSFNSLGWIDTLPIKVKNELEIISGDIRNTDIVRKSISDCNTVIHLAALIAIPFSYYSPEAYVNTNIMGTLNVLQSAKDYELEKIIITSTSEVYGTAKYTPIDENHPKQGQSPYSATKISADYLAESFHKSFQMPITIARPFNTFGPRQSARAVIPSMISQLLSGEENIKSGDLMPTRDFVFIKDTVNGFLEILNSSKLIGTDCNICTEKEISIGDLLNLLIKIINPSAKAKYEKKRTRPKNSEVHRLLGSNEKITSLTNWKPLYSLEDGLRETIDWFKIKDNLKMYKHNEYNI